MKTLLFPLAFVSALCLSKSHIYSQDIVWERSYGGKHAEYLMDVQPTADYGFILAGSSLSNKTGNKTDENRGDFDYWIWKMDESGELDWQKSFGGSGSDFLQSLKNTRDGGFILAGNSNSSNVTEKKGQNDKKEKSRGGDDFWIIKLDAKGNEEWQKTIGGWGQEKLKTICQTVDGGYIIGGSSSSHISGEKEENGFGNLDYWIVKLDKKGKIEWQKTFGGIYVDELRSLEQTKDLGYIVGGYSNSPKSGNKEKDNLGYGDYWVLKLDPKGEIEWQKVLGGDLDDQLSVVHQSYDGAYLLAGYSSSDATESRVIKGINGSDFWVVKLNEIGNVLWQEKYDIGDLDKLTSLVENKDHSLLLGGFAQSQVRNPNAKEANEINDYVAIKTSERGEEVWRKSVGSAGEDVLKKAIETRDGGYLLAGTSNPTQSNNLPVLTARSSKKPFVTQGENQMLNKNVQEAAGPINDGLNEMGQEANDLYKDAKETVTGKLNEITGIAGDSPLKTGLNLPENALSNPMSLGSGSGSNPGTGLKPSMGQNQKLPSSKDKKNNYGSTDFWVVKLKDKDKKKVVKASIEAFPNPAFSFTNVIVGYDFIKGTATLVDMAGRVLQQFPVTDRTVPVDLNGLPDGIYIVNIKTEKQSDGVKIIKGTNRN